MYQKSTVKLTIAQKTEILERFFETKNVIYQAKVGYMANTKIQNIPMRKLSEICQVMNLEISMVRNTNNGSITFLLETIQ